MLSTLLSAVPYLLAVGTIIIGILTLHKEWKDDKRSWVRRGVMLIAITVGVLTLISLYLDSDEKSKDQDRIVSLQAEVKSTNQAQKDNTALFLKTFTGFSTELSDLKTKVATEALRKEITGLQGELQKTQKALEPGRKARLTFSFLPPAKPNEIISPSLETTASVLPDGSVHVEFTVLNMTETEALDGFINVHICDECKFAKEPERFKRLAGQADNERHLPISRSLPKSRFQTLSIDVIPPANANFFVVGMSFRCRTCVLDTIIQKGTVRLAKAAGQK